MAGLLRLGGLCPAYVSLEDIVSGTVNTLVGDERAELILREPDRIVRVRGAQAVTRLQMWLDKHVELSLHDCESFTFITTTPEEETNDANTADTPAKD